jgi:hypothetical protein
MRDDNDAACRSAPKVFTVNFAGTLLAVSLDHELPIRQLTWKSCSLVATDGGGADGLWQFVEGQKTLTEAEYKAFEAALRALAPSSKEGCGFDKPTLTVNATTPHGAATYLDDFYSSSSSSR